ncbi:MAG TPA: M48 family metallopeptidase [Caulobacteraceae bacterium]|nr:M48 family metallopeptidase [Caulobacteraceae bacterium]
MIRSLGLTFIATDPRFAAGEMLEVAGCPVRLKVDRRARRVSLRLDAARGEVIATAPSPRRLKEAAAFAAQRAAWIGEAIGRLPPAEPLSPGAMLQVLGRPCRLKTALGPRRQGLYEEDGLVLRAWGEGEAFRRAALRVLKAEALKALSERSATHAAALDRPAPKVAVMDARSRWGSCTPARPGRAASLRYSWRLILAPFEVLDYVAAHECGHLVHADHSPRFWALVASLGPDMKRSRAWLRAHGPRLHAVGR